VPGFHRDYKLGSKPVYCQNFGLSVDFLQVEENREDKEHSARPQQYQRPEVQRKDRRVEASRDIYIIMIVDRFFFNQFYYYVRSRT
jgi:hypothetical protein